MTGRGEPPEGPSENPSGGEDEYRSLVFDESFVRAARLQEFSAQERMGEHARAVRSLPRRGSRRRHSRAGIALVVLIVLAFATAVYTGFRNPYPTPVGRRAEPLRTTVIPLAPQGPVPGGTAVSLLADGPATGHRSGASGINLPPVRRTKNFSDSQVTMALTTVKDYLVNSSLDPDVLTGGVVRPVGRLLDPDQTAQFDRSVGTPAGGGEDSAIGWLVRFDPAEVELAAPDIRVRGTLSYAETGSDTLEVVSDHTFTYVLRPAAPGPHRADGASLFTVRRVLHFLLDREDIRLHRLEVRNAYVQAGPQSCSAAATGVLRPLLAGERAAARGPSGTDPYATGVPTAALCGTLAVSSPDPGPLRAPDAARSPRSRP